MKSVYVITCQAFDANTISVHTNLKALHKGLIAIQGGIAPTYAKICKAFKNRKEYYSMSTGFHHNNDYKSVDVTYTQIDYQNK